MKLWLLLSVAGLSSLGTGCGLIRTAARNVCYEVHECCEEVQECRQTRKLACEAWDEVVSANEGDGYSEDHAAGFKEGFADFIREGGTGEPPALPPKCYWKSRYETPRGHQAIEEWFAGFRHGATVAQAGGYRQWLTLPSALGAPPTVLGSLPVQHHKPPLNEVPVVEEQLPMPRKVSQPAISPKPALPTPSSSAPPLVPRDAVKVSSWSVEEPHPPAVQPSVAVPQASKTVAVEVINPKPTLPAPSSSAPPLVPHGGANVSTWTAAEPPPLPLPPPLAIPQSRKPEGVDEKIEPVAFTVPASKEQGRDAKILEVEPLRVRDSLKRRNHGQGPNNPPVALDQPKALPQYPWPEPPAMEAGIALRASVLP